jgi:hypothetical protein
MKMGWSLGYDETWKRDIGYGVPAYCDHPGCSETIHRGLVYVCCDQEPYGGEGCGLYFCTKHSDISGTCINCSEGNEPFTPSAEHPVWVNHKLTDESWRQWRDENPEEVIELQKIDVI